MLAALWFTPSVSVNLPRWGLKQNLHFQILVLNELCKFTPLWFETSKTQIKKTLPKRRVNLPRWGLKLSGLFAFGFAPSSVNLPRWGLKLG